MKSTLKLSGTFILRVTRADGSTEEYKYKNMFVDAGLHAFAAALATGALGNKFEYIALGTGVTPAAPADLTLEAETVRKAAGVLNHANTAVVEFTASWQVGSVAGDLSEAGIFNAAATGMMMNRLTFSPVTVGASDAVAVTWNIEFKRA